MLKNQNNPTYSSNTLSNPLLVEYYPGIAINKIPILNKTKLTPKSNPHVELDLFKQQIRKSGDPLVHYTYAHSRLKVRWYRAVFFAIAVVFLILAAFAFRQNIQMLTLFFGNVALLAKAFLGGICLTLGVTAATLGYSLCIAKEASHHLASKAKQKLLRLYGRKRIEMGIQGFLFLGGNHVKHLSIRQDYYETLDLIHEEREKTTHLLQEIQIYVSTDARYRELLFNQALTELENQLQGHLLNWGRRNEKTTPHE